MLQQFRQILNSPKHTTSQILRETQDLILQAFMRLFPEDYDLSQLHRIQYEVIGERCLTEGQQISIATEQQASMIQKLMDFFIKSIQTQFIEIGVYQLLQEQTQKAEGTIRSHIKTQHQMKMYLDYLEGKIQKYQKIMDNTSVRTYPNEDLKRQIHLMANKQAILLKEKINLLKKNQELKLQVSILTSQFQAQSRDTFIIHDNNEDKVSLKISNLAKKYDHKEFQSRPSLQSKQNLTKIPVTDMQKLLGLKSPPSNLKSQIFEPLYSATEHTNDSTQKKKPYFYI